MHLFERARVADEAAVVNKIPVIDCAAYFSDQPGAEAEFVAQLRDACENVGFFYIRGHGVPQQLIDGCFAASKEFHALPLERKLAVRQDVNNIGYMAMNQSYITSDEIHRTTHPNQNASFFIGHDRPDDHPDVLNKVRLRGKNRWPEGLPAFRERTMAYFEALEQVAQRLVPAFALALGLERHFFEALFADEAYIEQRLLYSPPQSSTSDDRFSIAPHTDISFITLLAREHEEKPGLSVRLKTGEWFKAPIIDGTFLVNLGDVMRRFSNGTFMSTPHGVVNEGSKDRYSIAFFYSPNPNAVVAPVPSMVSDDAPPKYDPVLYGELAKAVHERNYRKQLA